MMEKCDVLIVGGGAAGCLTAIQIHKNHPELKIVIAEPEKKKLARGVAYSKHFIHQPLNVRVKGMSADPDDQEHFERWLTENQTRYPYFEFDRNTFVSRSIYGDYLEEYFSEYLKNSGGRVSVTQGKMNAIQFSEEGFISTTTSAKIPSTFVVLATGNFLPKPLPVSTAHLSHDQYFPNPWLPDLYSRLESNRDVFLVGSGLTAIDIILELHARNHQGKIHLLSRNGYLPLSHKEPEKHFFSDPSTLLGGNIYEIFSVIREEVHYLHDPRKNWQDIIDSMRAFTAKAWEHLPDDHKNIFLRKFKPYWEIHRHRIPERSMALISNLKRKGRLIQHRGNLTGITNNGDHLSLEIKRRDESESVSTSYLINCTGPDADFRKQENALYKQLFSELNLSTDKFHLGLNCTAAGKVMDKENRIINNLFCIGSLRKGVLWETTALSDIRIQAKEIAHHIINC